MVMVQEWNFTWPLLSPGATYVKKIVISSIFYKTEFFAKFCLKIHLWNDFNENF